jgi:nucleotide sugar dehydrogenase
MTRTLSDGRPVSTGPDGDAYAIPTPEEIEVDYAALCDRAARQRALGRRVVVVQGLGFVGAAVAAVVAGATDEAGEPRYFVIGVDLPTPHGYWKVAKVNAGLTPIVSPDRSLDGLTGRAVREAGNLCATASPNAYALADVIVIDIPLDVHNRVETDPARISVGLNSFDAGLRAVGRAMRPDALVLIETTVPFGTTEQVARRVLTEGRAQRGITGPVSLAYAYERVMPGANYINSIRQFWRSYAGVDRPSAERAREFLASFIDTARFPLRELDDPTSCELAKLLENSYRAVNIAFIHEWTLLAERIGVNLFAVVDSIRVRRGTHDNMRYPGFGVGGYCLTKDSLLAQWAARNLFGSDARLPMTLAALETNYHMPAHTFELLAELAGGGLAGMTVAVCGLSYLPQVGDTRNSPCERLVEELNAAGCRAVLHDPYVAHWVERPEVPVSNDLTDCLRSADAVLLTVPHPEYRDAAAADWLRWCPAPPLVVDAQNVLSDATAEALFAAGGRVLGVGKGHWRTRGYHVGSR